MRAIGLDLGTVRIGVALSDSAGAVATPYATIQRTSEPTDDHTRVSELVAETGAAVVVVGWPLSLDGGEGPAARAARHEAERLAARLAVPVVLHDERLTSAAAERSLPSQRGARPGTSPRRRRSRRRQGVVDQVAAAILLQSWLDGGGPSRLGSERLV